jgi:hypothetical protein
MENRNLTITTNQPKDVLSNPPMNVKASRAEWLKGAFNQHIINDAAGVASFKKRKFIENKLR